MIAGHTYWEKTFSLRLFLCSIQMVSFMECFVQTSMGRISIESILSVIKTYSKYLFILAQLFGHFVNIQNGWVSQKMYCFSLIFTLILRLKTSSFTETVIMKSVYRQKYNYLENLSKLIAHTFKIFNPYTLKNKWKLNIKMTIIRSKDVPECLCIKFLISYILTQWNAGILDGPSWISISKNKKMEI